MDILKSKQLREARAKLIADARAIDTTSAENRAKVDTMLNDSDAMMKEIERWEKIEADERSQATPASGQPAENRDEKAKKYEGAFRAYMSGADLTPEQRSILKEGYREDRTAQSTTTTAGGYTIPQGYQPEIAKAEAMFNVMAAPICRELNTDSGNDIPWPTVDDTSVKGRLIAESAAITNTAVAFGQKILKAFKWSSDSLLVPSELMQDSAFDLGPVFGELLGERIGRIKADYYTTGTGSSQPEGVVAGSALGKTAASATAIIADELIELYHSVDPAYRTSPKCRFMFNDTTFRVIRQLKESTTGNYLWQPGLKVGEQDLLLGKPFSLNQSMDSIAAGKKVVLFGDFNKYVVRNVNGILVRRLNELYAANDQVGFVAFARSDARYVYGGSANGAVKHLITAAS